MKKFEMRALLIVLVLAALSFACNFPARSPVVPPTAPPMEQEEAQQLEDQLQATLANPGATGEVTVNITEAQLNAFVVSQMAEQEEQFLTNPVIVLTNGFMEVYGTASQGGISANTKIVLQPRVDPDGTLKLDVVSINLGPIPVTGALKDRAEAIVDDALSDYLNQNSNQFKVTNVTISEDLITVTGMPQQP